MNGRGDFLNEVHERKEMHRDRQWCCRQCIQLPWVDIVAISDRSLLDQRMGQPPTKIQTPVRDLTQWLWIVIIFVIVKISKFFLV
jgi:hypothetical protein